MRRPTHIGRFRILGLVGQGAMGVVYRGRDDALERDVAIKVMSAAVLGDRESRERFLREARASARLQHTNIVTIYELGEHEGLPFMALELLEGLDLQRAIEAGIRPDPKLTLPIILQLLAGLGHAHDHGIIHRDVKPSNVFLPDGRPIKIMDFGVARIGGAGMATQGMVVGTPTYMSPEQVKGGHLDGRSDLFSVGLILFELVTGEKCLQGNTVVELLYKVVHQDRDLSSLPTGRGWDALKKALAKALKRDPDERYAHADAMTGDLVHALRELGATGDWTQATDLGLLLRNPRARGPMTMADAPTLDEPTLPGVTTPRPTLAPAQATQQATAPTDEMPRNLYEARPRARTAVENTRRPAWLAPAVGGAALVLLVLALVVWRLVGPTSRPSPSPTESPAPPVASPTPPASPSAGASPSPSKPTPAPSPATPTPSPTTAATPSPSQPSPAAPSPSPTTAQSSPAPGPSPTSVEPSPAEPTNPRIERAEQLLESGRFQQALAEAKAVLAREPRNAAAKDIAQEAEVSLLVEQVLKNAKAALGRGEKDDAIEELKKGLSIRPTDARLLDLWRQATQ